MKYSLPLSTSLLLFGIILVQAGLATPSLPASRPQCVTTVTAKVRPDCGSADGRIGLTHDGTAPFTYNWSHSATLNDSVATGLAGGTYFITISDAAGCQIKDTVVVPISRLLVAGGSAPDTCGAGKGGAGVQVVSGIKPYTYQWDSLANFQIGQVAFNLKGGTYAVTVTDSVGCKTTQTLSVANGANNFSAAVGAIPVTCIGRSDGSAFAKGNGGAGTYTYSWSLNTDPTVIGTADSIKNIPAGFYFVTIQSGTTCSATIEVPVGAPDTLVANLSLTSASGCSTNNGSAIASPQGGVGPFQVIWSTGDTAISIDNLRQGNYSVLVTDGRGCKSEIQDFLIPTTQGPVISVDILQEDVCGLGQGIVRVNIAQGKKPYNINWYTSTSQIQDSIYAYNLFDTPFQYVIVTDADTCLKSAYFDMPGNKPLLVTGTSSTEDYCQLADGTASVTVTGGVEPYSYTWTSNPIQFTQTATAMPAGTFEVIIQDDNLCETRTTVTIDNLEGFTLFTDATDVTCYGEKDGTARAVNFGGFSPVNMTWGTTPPRNGGNITKVPPGAYTIEAVDIRGCRRTGYVNIEQPDSLYADFNVLPDTVGPIPQTLATFAFQNTSLGATSYLWNFGDGEESSSASPNHKYEFQGEYPVRMYAYNNNRQCVDSTDYGPITVIEDGRVFIPNAFTPNSTGVNDVFLIKGVNISEVDFRVFGRTGREIFATNTLDAAWDGQMSNGRSAPEGVYAYTIWVKFSDNQEISRKGLLTIIR